MKHQYPILLMMLALVTCVLTVMPLQAQPGDCSGDGAIGINDLVSITTYLSGGAPPADYADCDCDGFPGVNFGDSQQLVAAFFAGGPLFPSPGSDLITASSADMSIIGQPDAVTVFRTRVYLNAPTSIDGGLTLPFSFVSRPGESDLVCTGVTIGATFAGPITVNIDNVGKSFRLTSTTAVSSSVGYKLLCEANFVLGAGGAGAPVCVKAAPAGRYFPLLLSAQSYVGIDYIRMTFPRIGSIPGDANCDAALTISDIVYVINYIFGGGPAPCKQCS